MELDVESAGGWPSIKLFFTPRDRVGSLTKGVGTFRTCHVLQTLDARHAPSPVVLIKDIQNDKGRGLWRRLRAIIPHRGLADDRFAGQTHGFPSMLLVNNALFRHAPGTLDGHSAIPLQDLGEVALRQAADAVREHNEAAARALRVQRPFYQTSALLYRSGGTLADHTDGVGNYLALFSIGNAVEFSVAGRRVRFESGDVLVFHGATVMHGVVRVYDGTGPPELPQELRGVRVSVQIRQQ